MAMKYRWEVIEKTICYEGFFKLERYRLRHELFEGGWGDEIVREMLERGHAAGILLYDPQQDSVVLVEQFRIGALAARAGPWLLEVVAGIVEPGEDPAEVARREAMEEAGCEVLDLREMTEFVLSAGGSSETIKLYCGRVHAPESGGIYGIRHEGEDIRAHVLRADEALALLDGGRLLSAMTVIALQWLALHRHELRGRWSAAT
jgi:ADP-ribose pyrophosphatase